MRKAECASLKGRGNSERASVAAFGVVQMEVDIRAETPGRLEEEPAADPVSKPRRQGRTERIERKIRIRKECWKRRKGATVFMRWQSGKRL